MASGDCGKRSPQMTADGGRNQLRRSAGSVVNGAVRHVASVAPWQDVLGLMAPLREILLQYGGFELR